MKSFKKRMSVRCYWLARTVILKDKETKKKGKIVLYDISKAEVRERFQGHANSSNGHACVFY